jgi:hypothetical protein
MEEMKALLAATRRAFTLICSLRWNKEFDVNSAAQNISFPVWMN